MTLIIALNYGGRAEVAAAARELARKVAAGELAPEDIDERLHQRPSGDRRAFPIPTS